MKSSKSLKISKNDINNLNNLLKDRNFINQKEPHSEILESIVNSMLQNANMFYIKSNVANHFVFSGDTDIIVWDLFYWDLFEKHLMLVQLAEDSVKDTDKMVEICQLVLANFSYFISSKFNNNIDLSIIMLKDSFEYGYKQLYKYDYSSLEIPVVLSKIFTLFHEIAHITFDRDTSIRNKYYKYVRENLCKENDLELMSMVKEFYEIDEVLIQSSINDLLNGKNLIILEEIAADHFAVIHTYNYAVLAFRKIADKSLMAYLLKKAIMALFDFNSYINNLNVEWNFMLPAIKLKVTREDFFLNRITKNRFKTNFTNLIRDNISIARMALALFKLGEFSDDDKILRSFMDESDDSMYYGDFFGISLSHSLFDEKYVMERIIGANKMSLSNQFSHNDKLAIRNKIMESMYS